MNNFLTNSYSYCDTIVDQVTDPSNSEENWLLTLCICDNVTKDPSQAKAFLRAIMKKWFCPDPRVVLKSLDLLETIICNCGFTFRFEVASAEFESEFLRFLNQNHDLVLRNRFLQSLENWAKGLFSLNHDSRLSRIPILLEKIKSSQNQRIILNPNNLGFGQFTYDVVNQNVGQQFVSPYQTNPSLNYQHGQNSPNSSIKSQNTLYPTLTPYIDTSNQTEEIFRKHSTQISLPSVNLDLNSNYGNKTKSYNPFITDIQSQRNSISIPENDKYSKFLPENVVKIGSKLPNLNANVPVNINGIQNEKSHKPISESDFEFEFPPPPSWILENGHSNIENKEISKNLSENGKISQNFQENREISKNLKDCSPQNKRKSISPNPSISESFNEELNNALKNGIGKLKPRNSFNDFTYSKMANSNGVSELARETKDDSKSLHQKINYRTDRPLRKTTEIGTSRPRPKPNPKNPNPNRNSAPVTLLPVNSNENPKKNDLENDISVKATSFEKKFEQSKIPHQKLHLKPEILSNEKSVNTKSTSINSPKMIPSQNPPPFKPDLPKRPTSAPVVVMKPVIPPRLPKNKNLGRKIENNLNNSNPEKTSWVQNLATNLNLPPPPSPPLPPPPPPQIVSIDDFNEKKPSTNKVDQKEILTNGNSGRSDLLKDIQKGIPLRKVEDSDKSKSTKSCKLASALQRQLATIKAATHSSDSDSDSNEEKYDNDEEWNENETNC